MSETLPAPTVSDYCDHSRHRYMFDFHVDFDQAHDLMGRGIPLGSIYKVCRRCHVKIDEATIISDCYITADSIEELFTKMENRDESEP